MAAIGVALVIAGCGASAPETTNPSQTPPGSATPEPSISAVPSTRWKAVATFGHEGGWNFAGSVVRSGEVFLAVGSRAEPAHVGYDTRELMWTSTDGQSWDEVPLGSELDGLYLWDVVPGPGGSFIAYLEVGNALGSGTTNNTVWQSADGRTWQVADTDLDPSILITKVVQGARGYLLHGQRYGERPSLWLSADGLHWEEVHRFTDPSLSAVNVEDLGAGDEGFVVLGFRVGSDSRDLERFALASADGRVWIDAPDPYGDADSIYHPRPVIAPLGPDWVAAIAQQEGGVRMWISADGLDWSVAAVIPEVNTQVVWGPVMVGANGRLFFSPGGAFPPERAPGVWSSLDGRHWESLDLGEDGVVRGAASTASGIVLAGATFSDETESAATFWLGP